MARNFRPDRLQGLLLVLLSRPDAFPASRFGRFTWIPRWDQANACRASDVDPLNGLPEIAW